jgi:hypothetical protein
MKTGAGVRNVQRAATLLEAELADLEAGIDPSQPFNSELSRHIDGLIEALEALAAAYSPRFTEAENDGD